MTIKPNVRHERGLGLVEVFPYSTDETALFDLLRDAFENHWHEIVFGTLVMGAVFEIRTPTPPTRITLSNGYLTVDFGPWHFHVCLGAYSYPNQTEEDVEVACLSRTARAEFFRLLHDDGSAKSWGIRLYNGAGEQQISVFFPNPFATADYTLAPEPDWGRLAMWDDFRRRYLGLEPKACDRSATRPK